MKRVRSEVDKGIDILWNIRDHTWDVFYTNPKSSQKYLIFKADELDQRIILRLQIGDSHRWPNAKIKHLELLEREERWKENKEAKFKEERKYKLKQDRTLWAYALRNARNGNFG